MKTEKYINELLVKYQKEFTNYEKIKPTLITELKKASYYVNKGSEKKELEIQAKENILEKKVLEATEIIAKAEKVISEKEKDLIDKINPDILLWKNKKKIIELT